ncbi:MAG TPA: LysE family translocator [Acetobacteraceae bacterium]|nr:LysE family translocator [Acetobacteraceae bacterium]
MPVTHWLAFAAASAVLLAIPGPTVLLVISYSLGHGKRLAAPIVGGVALGDFTAMTASMAGLGALLLASAEVFTILKWVGAAYLIYLGIRLWHAPSFAADAGEKGSVPPRRAFLHAYAVTALNPKSLLFFVAFVPQFLLRRAPFLPQILVFEAIFLALATANAALYAAMASAARQTIRRPEVQRIVNRAGGSLLIGAGLLAAAWRRGQA